MQTVTKSFELAAGHRLKDHNGQCRNVHGHNYRFDITIANGFPGQEGQLRGGMVLDFSHLKDHVERILSRWDHAFIYEAGDAVGEVIRMMEFKTVELPVPPTAEHLSRVLGEELQCQLDGSDGRRLLHVARVATHEGPRNVASWTAPGFDRASLT